MSSVLQYNSEYIFNKKLEDIKNNRIKKLDLYGK